MTEDRFRELISDVKVSEEGCWLWQGRRSPNGYAIRSQKTHSRLLHRAVYEHCVGELVRGAVIHHVCEVRHCINPEHLRQVSYREHSLIHPKAEEKNPTPQDFCKRGHPLVEGNLYWSTGQRGKKQRKCRICSISRSRSRTSVAGAAQSRWKEW